MTSSNMMFHRSRNSLLLVLALALLATPPAKAQAPTSNTIATHVECPAGTNPLNPLVVKGKRFFDSVTGEYVPLQGIAYYPRPNGGPLATGQFNSVDFFVDAYRDTVWESDIQKMQELGVNLVRIYAVDPSQNHNNFMCALQHAGIYAMIGLLADCEGCAVGPDEAPSCYPLSLKQRGHFIINEFSKYRNTIAFSAGNEVTLYARNRQIELNAPCQKKFLRDMREYMTTCSATPNTVLPRPIPIGMVNWDFERTKQTLYFNCRNNGTDALETPEWYGLNSYQHCNAANTNPMALEGWEALRQDFVSYNLPVPVVIGEYGCRTSGFDTIDGFAAQRNWLQVDALYSSTYAEVFAGGVVFEFSAEKSVVDESAQQNPWPYNDFMKLQYGVGYYEPIDCDHTSENPCTYIPYPEFNTLAEKLAATASSTSLPTMDAYTIPQQITPECPVDMPSILEYGWPTDADPGTPCYVIETPPPTIAPTTGAPSASPTNAPTVTGATPAPSTSAPTDTGATPAPSLRVDGGGGPTENVGNPSISSATVRPVFLGPLGLVISWLLSN